MLIRCKCGKRLDVTGFANGSLVRCKACKQVCRVNLAMQPQQQQTLPKEQKVAVATINIPPQQPSPQLTPNEWFNRAFSATLGVLVCLFFVFVAIPLGVLFVLMSISGR